MFGVRVVYESERLRDVNKKTKINLPKQHIPCSIWATCFVFFFSFLWVSFNVKKSLSVSNTLSQAIPVDGHVCVLRGCFWTIVSYAIVCSHGYHTDQKHANRRIVVTGLESGGLKNQTKQNNYLLYVLV